MFAIIRNGLMKIINGNLQKAESLGRLQILGCLALFIR